MRILGFLVLLVGLIAAFGYPFYQTSFTNFEVGKYTIYDKNTGFSDQTIWLAPEDTPLNIHFNSVADAGEFDESSKANTSINLQISTGESIIHTQTITLSQSAESSAIKSFDVPNGAFYAFSFSEAETQSLQLSSITMTITGIVIAMNETIPTVGYVLIGFGALMYLVGGRRKSKTVGNAPSGKSRKTSQIGRRADPEPTKTEKPKQPSRKWGRGE